MIESPILTRQTINFTSVDDTWWLCSYELHKVFDFPKGVKQIQFQAWPEPGPDRTKIKIKKPYSYFDYYIIEIDGENQGITRGTIATIMELTKKRRTWYVKLYYWI